jgi:hypothetical protein
MKHLLAYLMTILCALASFNSAAEEPIKLESHFVGDKEQPAVSYFMPWKGPGSSADELEQKQEDKYEKSIDAVDRDVMLRSMRIYNELNLEGH